MLNGEKHSEDNNVKGKTPYNTMAPNGFFVRNMLTGLKYFFAF